MHSGSNPLVAFHAHVRGTQDRSGGALSSLADDEEPEAVIVARLTSAAVHSRLRCGSISITLPDGTPATSKLEMTRTPPATPPPTSGPDTAAPILRTRGYVGARASVPLRWQARDAGGKATFDVVVTPQTQAASPTPLFTRKLANRTVDSGKLTAFSIA